MSAEQVARFLAEAKSLYRSADMAEEEADQYLEMAREAGATEEQVESMFREVGR